MAVCSEKAQKVSLELFEKQKGLRAIIFVALKFRPEKYKDHQYHYLIESSWWLTMWNIYLLILLIFIFILFDHI